MWAKPFGYQKSRRNYKYFTSGGNRTSESIRTTLTFSLPFPAAVVSRSVRGFNLLNESISSCDLTYVMYNTCIYIDWGGIIKKLECLLLLFCSSFKSGLKKINHAPDSKTMRDFDLPSE